MFNWFIINKINNLKMSFLSRNLAVSMNRLSFLSVFLNHTAGYRNWMEFEIHPREI